MTAIASKLAPTGDLCCSGDQVASAPGYLFREPSNHSIAVRQMQIPRKYADISSQSPITSGLITGWLTTSDKLHSNQMAVTAMLIGMNLDRKSTRLNSSHTVISYAVFCLKKNKIGQAPGFMAAVKAKLATMTPVLQTLKTSALCADAVLDGCVAAGLDLFFFFNDTATTEIYTLSLHDALPICADCFRREAGCPVRVRRREFPHRSRSEEHTSELQSHSDLVCRLLLEKKKT